MFHQSSLDTIMGRFPSPDDPVVRGSLFFEDWRNRTEAAAKAVRVLVDRRADLAAAGKLSEKGLAEEVAKMADKEVRPHVTHLEDALSAMDAAEGRLRDGAGALAPIDQGNVEAVAIRADIRRHILSLPLGERVRLALTGDEITQQAIETAPAYLTGLPPEVR